MQSSRLIPIDITPFRWLMQSSQHLAVSCNHLPSKNDVQDSLLHIRRGYTWAIRPAESNGGTGNNTVYNIEKHTGTGSRAE
jgi:hypothetical protein